MIDPLELSKYLVDGFARKGAPLSVGELNVALFVIQDRFIREHRRYAFSGEMRVCNGSIPVLSQLEELYPCWIVSHYNARLIKFYDEVTDSRFRDSEDITLVDNIISAPGFRRMIATKNGVVSKEVFLLINRHNINRTGGNFLIDFNAPKSCIKPPFDPRYFVGSYKMHCSTYEQSCSLCLLLKSIGYTWSGGEEYSDENTRWGLFKGETCYMFNEGLVSNRNINDGNKVLEFSDFSWPDILGGNCRM